jgi:hypothetical protein
MRNDAPPVRHGNESRLTGWEVNNGFEAWVLARYLGQVQPDADFIPAASRALYTLPRPMFSAVATSVTERPALKSFTASSALSRADGLRPCSDSQALPSRCLPLTLKHHFAFELAKPEKMVSG